MIVDCILNNATAVTEQDVWFKDMVNHVMGDLMKQQKEELQMWAEIEPEGAVKREKVVGTPVS